MKKDWKKLGKNWKKTRKNLARKKVLHFTSQFPNHRKSKSKKKIKYFVQFHKTLIPKQTHHTEKGVVVILLQILQILPQLKTNLNSVTGTVLHAILVFNIWESEFLFNPSAVAASNYPWNDREQNNSVDWSMPAKAVCFVKIKSNFCFFCQKVSFLLIKTVNTVIIIQIKECLQVQMQFLFFVENTRKF